MQEKSKEKLFAKYNLEIKQIRFENAPDLTEIEKEKIVFHILEAYEFARKNRLAGNVTGSSYSCCILDENLTPHYGVNFNATRNEISSICAERLAILQTFFDEIENFNPDKNKEADFNFKIKYILMNSYKNEGDFTLDKVTPCADCLSWFNTGWHLTKDTSFASLKKDENGYFVHFQKLEDFLPLRNLSFDIVPIEKVKGVFNLTNLKVDEKKIFELYKKTFEKYQKNTLAKTSMQNTAAGVISNGEIFTGVKVDFSKRWFIDPLEMAFSLAVNKFEEKAKIDAICCIGEEYTVTESGKKVKDGLISIKLLGRLLTKYATRDTLVVTATDNRVEIRTVGDFLPGDCTFVQGYEIK